MNIDELNAFYDRLETNPLTPSAIALWHALAYIRDKNGLSEWFAVAASSLCAKAGIKEDTFYKVRNTLEQKGYIEVKSRRGNQAALYRISVCTRKNTDDFTDKEIRTRKNPVNFTDNLTDNFTDNLTDNFTVLDRQQTDNRQIDARAMADVKKATFADIEKSWVDVFRFSMKPNHYEMVNSFLEQDGMSESLILEAIDRVNSADSKTLNYLWRTLGNWAKLGIKTIGDLTKHEIERAQVIPTKKKTDNLAKLEEIFAKRGVNG